MFRRWDRPLQPLDMHNRLAPFFLAVPSSAPPSLFPSHETDAPMALDRPERLGGSQLSQVRTLDIMTAAFQQL